MKGTYSGSDGGTLTYDGANWTYVPKDGHVGAEEFNVNAWDGQKTYTFNPTALLAAAHKFSTVARLQSL